MNTGFTLYVNPMTVNSIKMLLFCHATDLKPDYINIELHRGEQKSGKFLQINPDGKVPVLVDGNFILSESNAILQYLAHKYQSPLWPDNVAAQGEVLKWLFWQMSYWNKAVGVYSHRRVILPHWGFEARWQLSPEEMEKFHLAMSGVERALTGKPALVGSDFSVADISLGSYLIFASEAEIPLEDYPNVCRWLNQLRDIGWWQKTEQALRAVLYKQMHNEL